MDETDAQLECEVYERLRNIAKAHLHRERADHTLQPTALVHEAYLQMARQDARRWNDATHFAALASQAMRRILVDYSRRRDAERRGGRRRKVTLDDDVAPASGAELDLLELGEALEELTALDERQARVVELRFFGGLSLNEAAARLGVARSTAAADWQMARAWLNWRLSR